MNKRLEMSEFEIRIFCMDGYDLYIVDGGERSTLLLEFDDEQDAIDVANHWANWIVGLDV